jgi:hypothetical protein
MKSFQYKAKNQQGQILEGVIETQHFAEATSMIQARGLELLSMEELKSHIEATMPYIFDAIDKEGEPVQGTIQGVDEDVVKQKLEEEFGYEVSKVYKKNDPTLQTEVVSPVGEERANDPEKMPEEKSEDSIIFQSAPRIIHSKPVIPEEELGEVHESIQLLLVEKGAAISPATRDRLLHLDGMIDLVRESQNKARWKILRHDIRDAQKLAEREIQHYEDEKWRAYEQKNPAPKIQSYSDFPVNVSRFVKANDTFSRMVAWMQTIDLPNENRESEVLAKQQYESVWTELQRFSGALMAFYLAFFFISYYLKRIGMDESLLVRIYDTTLFKQLIVGIFAAYALLTVRKEYMNKRIKEDAFMLLLFAALLTFFL